MNGQFRRVVVVCCLMMSLFTGGCATRRPAALASPRDTPAIIPLDPPQYEVTSPFGLRGGHFHKGIDLRSAKGTPILAAADGTVLFAGTGRGYGRIVKLGHAHGVETWYAHLDAFRVGERDRVRQGERIGRVGTSGNSTGPHLHYEVHVNGQAVDPAPYLKP